MTTTIRAAVLTEPGKPLTIWEVQLKDPGPREVRIALRSTGLCGTDLHVIEGSIPHPMPVVLAHEGMGGVVDSGAEVSVARRHDGNQGGDDYRQRRTVAVTVIGVDVNPRKDEIARL